MSRLYEDLPLRRRPLLPEPLPGRWEPEALQGGPGAVLEGTLSSVSHHHIKPTGSSPERYFILYIQPTKIHKRKFDSVGVEIEPNFSETKKVNTGYLMSSFKVEAKGQTDKISVDELKSLINKPELLRISEKHTPDQSLAFWIPEREMENIELEIGDGLRLKTRGDSPFIFSLAKMDAGIVTKCNFAGGEKMGASWTDNIFTAKSKKEQDGKAITPGEGADDDEWED